MLRFSVLAGVSGVVAQKECADGDEICMLQLNVENHISSSEAESASWDMSEDGWDKKFPALNEFLAGGDMDAFLDDMFDGQADPHGSLAAIVDHIVSDDECNVEDDEDGEEINRCISDTFAEDDDGPEVLETLLVWLSENQGPDDMVSPTDEQNLLQETARGMRVSGFSYDHAPVRRGEKLDPSYLADMAMARDQMLRDALGAHSKRGSGFVPPIRNKPDPVTPYWLSNQQSQFNRISSSSFQATNGAVPRFAWTPPTPVYRNNQKIMTFDPMSGIRGRNARDFFIEPPRARNLGNIARVASYNSRSMTGMSGLVKRQDNRVIGALDMSGAFFAAQGYHTRV